MWTTRDLFAQAQQIEVWKRWKQGQSFSEIGRALGKTKQTVRQVVAQRGGVAPLNKVAREINQRPRKTLGFETPAAKLDQVLR